MNETGTPEGFYRDADGTLKRQHDLYGGPHDEPPAYPSPEHISYNEDSRWCQDHGHTGLLVGSVCQICDQLVTADPRFAAVLGTKHNPDGSLQENNR